MSKPRGKSKRRKVRGTVATTRLRKVQCDSCGAIAYLSRKWLEQGPPLCGTEGCAGHGHPMTWIDPLREEYEYGMAGEFERRSEQAKNRHRFNVQARCPAPCGSFRPVTDVGPDCDPCAKCGSTAPAEKRRKPREVEPAPF